MNSRILIAKSLALRISSIDIKLDEYEEEQCCITEENRVCPMKHKILSENITPKILLDDQLQANNNENLIEYAGDEFCEPKFINSAFKIPQLKLSNGY